MRRWAVGLLLLAGCSDEAGGDDGGAGVECANEPGLARCCGTGDPLSADGCDGEGGDLRQSDGDGVSRSECVNAAGDVELAVEVDKATGVQVYQFDKGNENTGDTERFCYGSTGRQRAYVATRGGARCATECALDDGTPASCAGIIPDVPACPE